MNDDFDTKLLALRPRALPAEWKAEILANAQPPSLLRSLAPPRWIAWSLAALWLTALILEAMTPSISVPDDLLRFEQPLPTQLQSRQDLLASLSITP